MGSRPEPYEIANRIPLARNTAKEIRRAGIWAAAQIRRHHPGLDVHDPTDAARNDTLTLLRELGVVNDPEALGRDAQYGSRTASSRRKGATR